MVKRVRLNRAYGIRNALQKINPQPIISERNPLSTDKGLPLGIHWINKAINHVYVLTSVVNGNANWEPVGTTGSAPISQYIVDANGSADYITVQSALDAANAAGGGIIYIRPGTYAENLTCYDNTEIVGAVGEVDAGNIIINGIHIPPTTGAFAARNIQFDSTTHIFNSAAAGTAEISINECVINVTNGFTLNLPNWTGIFRFNNCGAFGTDDGFVNNTAGASIFTNNSQLGAGSVNTFVANGTMRFDLTFIVCPANLTGSGTNIGLLFLCGNTITLGGSATWTIDNASKFFNTFTTADTVNIKIFNTTFETGANAAISHGSANPLSLSDISIDSTNNPAIAGAGAGVITLGSVTFLNNSFIAAALTLSNVPRLKTSGIGITEGANAISGLATLVAGTVTVNTTAVTANSRIQLTHQNNAGVPGFVSVTARVAGTSFTITSSNAGDTSDIAWVIIEPAN